MKYVPLVMKCLEMVAWLFPIFIAGVFIRQILLTFYLYEGMIAESSALAMLCITASFTLLPLSIMGLRRAMGSAVE